MSDNLHRIEIKVKGKWRKIPFWGEVVLILAFIGLLSLLYQFLDASAK